MSVYLIEEFYVVLDIRSASQEKRREIFGLINKDDSLGYKLRGENFLTVHSFLSVEEGEAFEQSIRDIISRK